MICWQIIKAGRLNQLYDLFQAGVYWGVKSTVPIGTSKRLSISLTKKYMQRGTKIWTGASILK